MQQPQKTSPIVQTLAVLIQFGIIGVLGSLVPALIGAVVYSRQTGLEIWILGAILLATYFPLRAAMSSIINKQGNTNYLPSYRNLPMFIIASIAFLFVIPVLWAATFSSMLVGLATYALFGQNLIFALITSLLFLGFNVYRQILNSPETTINNNFIVHFQDLSQRFGTDTIVLNSETLPDQSEFDDRWDEESDVIYHLPEQAAALHDVPDDETIIIFDPDNSTHHTQQD